MKQHFFMLLAAVLLSSTSAFAQSENNESVKGDVNGDGRVDIVDVTTVIDIYLNTDPDAPQTTTYYWYVGKTNPSTLEEYQSVLSGNLLPEIQFISKEEAMFETLMLGLRMNDGVNEQAFHTMHGVSLEAYRGPALRQQIQKGLIEMSHGSYRLTRRGMDIQNSILVDLMDP